MVFTKQHVLPSDEELTVEEINVDTVTLRAGAFQYGKYCENYNNEFMLCRKEEKDPRKCIEEGKMVTACALEFFRKVKKACPQELKDYAHCLDKSSMDMNPSHCRRTQAIYDTCIREKLGIDRPHYGYFCRVKVHHTERPKPTPLPFRKEFPDAPDALAEDYPRIKAAYGGRNRN